MVTFSQMAGVLSTTAAASGNSTKAEFGASPVTKTLDMLNRKKVNNNSEISVSYQAQKDILNAGLANKGVVVSTTG